MTLQKKLSDKAVAHPNPDVSSFLPASIAKYDFVFLDSVSRLGLHGCGLKPAFVFIPGISLTSTFYQNSVGQNTAYNKFVSKDIKHFDNWNRETINERQEILKKVVLKIWTVQSD